MRRRILIPFLLTLTTVCGEFDEAQCGITKKCFIPTTCPENCRGMGAAWRILNDETMELELFVNSESATGKYVAIGFSDDDKMGNEPVIECSSLGNQPASMKFSFDKATGKGNNRLNEDFSEFFNNSEVKTTNGILYCKSLVKISGQENMEEVFKYDPTRNYFILLANGKTKSSGISFHSQKQTAIMPKNRLNEVENRLGFDDTECGVSKGCTIPVVENCYGMTEGIRISYRKLDDRRIEFELAGPVNTTINNDAYLALGFAQQQSMNNQSVLECSQLPNESKPSMKFSYNEVLRNVRIDGEETIRQQLIEQKSSNLADGQIYCNAIVDVVTGGSENSPRIFKWNPTSGYYLMMAVGPTNDVGLAHHYGDCSTKHRVYLDQVQPLIDDEECGKTKGCFQPKCDGCDDMMATWRIIDEDNMAIELMAKINPTDSYVAFGFSETGQMGPAPLIECSSFNKEQHSLKYSLNERRSNIRSTSIDNSILTNPMIRQEDGIVKCSATYKINANSNDPTVFNYDPNRQYFLIMATGETRIQNGTEELMYHHQRRDVSLSKQFLNNYSPISTTIQPIQPTGTATFDSSTCGSTKSCFDYKTGETISYRILSDSSMEIEFYADLPSPVGNYIAVGFGQKAEMSPASVIECSSLGADPLSIKFSYNDGPTNSRINGEQMIRSQYVSDSQVSYIDGKAYCKGLIKIDGNSNSEIFKFDPTLKYYLLVAKGSATAGGLGYHGQQNRWISNQVSLDALSTGGASGNSPTLVILHAVFMTVAWLILVPTAVIFARVLRASWPTKKPFGLLIWFHIHRGANLIGIVLMIAAFVVILVHKNWKFTTEGWGGKHAIIGIVALVLGWLQPFISTLRCSPNDPRRPVFNYVHRAIGFSSMILATTAISIAGYHFTGSRNVAQLVLSLIPLTILLAISVFFLIFNKIVDDDDGDSNKFNKSRNGGGGGGGQQRVEDIPMQPTLKSEGATTWTIQSHSTRSATSDKEKEISKLEWTNRFREIMVYASVLAFIAIGTILSVFFAIGLST